MKNKNNALRLLEQAYDLIKTEADTVEPPKTNKMLLHENMEVRLCKALRKIQDHQGNVAADCFCGENPPRYPGERAKIDESVIKFFEDAVEEKIVMDRLKKAFFGSFVAKS